ncbi:MAG: hypothetical protein RLZZ502_1784 [Pseudomonadota bacterium]|jgi:methionyl-tRNA formyltransferase
MRIVFAGTPAFAAQALQAVLQAGHQVVAVYTQPDRPAGRGQQLMASSVKQVALAHGLPVEQPLNFKEASTLARLAAYEAKLMIVAAYGLILPPAVLDTPPYGCVNIHASLLPRWRGAAPIQRAIEAGDTETGICIMHMEAGLDTGPVYCHAVTPISPRDNAQTLHDKLSRQGAELVVQFLAQRAQLKAVAQSPQGVSYANKILKSESLIKFGHAESLTRAIQALTPSPGAVVNWSKNDRLLRVKLLDAQFEPASSSAGPNAPAGTIIKIDQAVHLACEQGCIQIAQLHSAGGKVQSAQQWCATQQAQVGDRFLPLIAP